MAYHPYIPDRVVRITSLYSLHYFHFHEGYAFPGERHDFWELVYVDMGGGKGYWLQILSIEKGKDDDSIPIGSF